MVLGGIIAGAIAISELGKNISEIVKNFFECVEIEKRIKREETLARTTTYIEENKNKLSVKVSYTVLEIKRTVEQKARLSGSRPTLLASKDLIKDNSCHWALWAIQSLSVKAFDEKTENVVDLLSKYISDSVVIITTEHSRMESSIYFYILNIVPSNDEKCYVLKIRMEHNTTIEDIYHQFSVVISPVINQTANIFYKYRESISVTKDRLELEIRILDKMGFSNLDITQLSDGYGIDLPLANVIVRKDIISALGDTPISVMIKFPSSFPKNKPLIVLRSKNNHTNVDLDVDWNSNYTIGHIVRALQEKRD